MKRQRVQTGPNDGYGYGYNSFGDASPASGAPEFALNPSGVNMQARIGRVQGASLSHGMQPNTQPSLQPGMTGMTDTRPGSSMYSGLPMNTGGVNLGSQYGTADVRMAGQFGQGLSQSMTPSMSQTMGQNTGSGQLMSQSAMSDMGASMLHSVGSGMQQNMMQNMGPNLSMGHNIGGAPLDAQAGLNPALGQGMGISEGFPCVKLRGLPFDANEQDIAVWLVCCWDFSWWPQTLLHYSRVYNVLLPGISCALVMGCNMWIWQSGWSWDRMCTQLATVHARLCVARHQVPCSCLLQSLAFLTQFAIHFKALALAGDRAIGHHTSQERAAQHRRGICVAANAHPSGVGAQKRQNIHWQTIC